MSLEYIFKKENFDFPHIEMDEFKEIHKDFTSVIESIVGLDGIYQNKFIKTKEKEKIREGRYDGKRKKKKESKKKDRKNAVDSRSKRKERRVKK